MPSRQVLLFTGGLIGSFLFFASLFWGPRGAGKIVLLPEPAWPAMSRTRAAHLINRGL